MANRPWSSLKKIQPYSLIHDDLPAMDDADLRQTLGKQGRREVLEKFDWSVIARQYSDLIQLVTS